MADIFISYSRQDRPKAVLLEKVLSNSGWTVWFDRSISAGRDFDEVIQEELNKARCVIALWSKTSVDSRWVKTEASIGVDRQILIPVLLENVDIPLEFKRIQAVDLVDWDGSIESELLKKLEDDISALIGSPSTDKRLPLAPEDVTKPSGLVAISGSKNWTIHMWDLETGDCLGVINQHRDDVISLSATQDGKLIVSGGDDSILNIMTMPSGVVLRTLQLDGIPSEVCISPDGRYVVPIIPLWNQNIYNVKTGKVEHTIRGHYSASISPSGSQLVVPGVEDNSIGVWDLTNGRKVRTLDGHDGQVHEVYITSDGSRLISFSNHDHRVIIWNLFSGELLWDLPHPKANGTFMGITKDGRLGFSQLDIGVLRVWSLDTGQLVGSLGSHSRVINAVTTSEDGQWAVSGPSDRTLKVWNLRTMEETTTLNGYELDVVMAVALIKKVHT